MVNGPARGVPAHFSNPNESHSDMKKEKTYRFETLAVHAGHGVDPATGAVVDPIHLSTTFEREADGSYPRGY